MRILQVITSLKIGGAEKLVVDMAPFFKNKGHIVDVFVFDGERTPFMQQIEEQGIRVIRYNNGASPYHPINILKLIGLIPQYDVIHTHNTACQYYVAIAKNLCCKTSLRFITTEHSANNRRRSMLFFKKVDKWMYSRYNSVVAISDKATDNLFDFLNGKIKIKTIYNGINLQKFVQAHPLKNDSHLQKRDKDFIITMVAGFRGEKDQDTLIKSLKYLPENCILWLVGDGVRRLDCEDLVKSLGLFHRVIFAGIRTDIPNILKTSDVIVMSSHWEGLSLSSIEGMSVGKPFVASDVDGLHEMVEGSGILFSHQDEKMLAEVILRLMNDPQYAQEVAQKCYDKACRYEIQNTVDEYLKIYQN